MYCVIGNRLPTGVTVKHPITCVILAGGKGTRALSVGNRLPKVLQRIAPNEPLISNAVNRALAIAAEVIVTTGPMRRFLKSALPESGNLIVLEDLGFGNAAALVAAACVAKYESTLVLNADTVNDMPYSNLVASHMSRGFGGSILLSRWGGAQNAGAYIVGSDGIVIRSLEDGKHTSYNEVHECWRGASTGVLLFPTSELRTIALLETDVVEKSITPEFIARRLLWAFDGGNSLTLDVGTPERIALAQSLPYKTHLRRD